MLTADGLPQGDPLSAMLFCNAVLSAYQRHWPPTITPTAYVDDVVIAGNPQEIEAAWDPLQKGLAEHGLHLNAAKSRMWVPPTVQYAFHHPQLYELASAKLEGLIICGSCLTVEATESIPLGSDTYCAHWLQDKASTLQKPMPTTATALTEDGEFPGWATNSALHATRGCASSRAAPMECPSMAGAARFQ